MWEEKRGRRGKEREDLLNIVFEQTMFLYLFNSQLIYSGRGLF